MTAQVKKILVLQCDISISEQITVSSSKDITSSKVLEMFQIAGDDHYKDIFATPFICVPSTGGQ